MIQKIGILFFFIGFLAKAQEPKKAFVIKGQVEGTYTDYIYLKTADNSIKDSCLVVNGKFNFSGNLDGTAQATLSLKPTSTVVFFYIENSSIAIDVVTSVFKNGNQNINDIEIKKISGSKTQELMLEVEKYQKEVETSTLSKDEKNKKIFKKYYEAVTMNPEYPIADFLIAKSKQKGTLSIDQVKDLSKFTSEKKKIMNEKDTLKIQNKAPISAKLAVGKKIEKFTLNNQKGKKVSIDDFKGKVVLINFWASWYKPTRINNMDLVKVYQKYKNKNLEIVSISIDTYDKSWMTAIENDNLTWTNLIDTDGWHGKVVTQFEIKGIPLNILVNKNGTIVAVNVTGDILREKLDYYLDVDSNN
ncbi:MAG: TlpA disulfide reductase family protein [Bacteroidota bacterium]